MPNSPLLLSKSQKVFHGRWHESYRGTLFRGISKNGKFWQILTMIENQKWYICSCIDPYEGATLYDITVIQHKCLQAKVNFDYDALHLLAILFEKNVLRLKLNF